MNVDPHTQSYRFLRSSPLKENQTSQAFCNASKRYIQQRPLSSQNPNTKQTDQLAPVLTQYQARNQTFPQSENRRNVDAANVSLPFNMQLSKSIGKHRPASGQWPVAGGEPAPFRTRGPSREAPCRRPQPHVSTRLNVRLPIFRNARNCLKNLLINPHTNAGSTARGSHASEAWAACTCTQRCLTAPSVADPIGPGIGDQGAGTTRSAWGYRGQVR